MRKQDLHPRTAVLNKTQKNRSQKERKKALSWLAKTFPLVFDNSSQIQPLKIGIMEDILEYAPQAAEMGVSKSKLREAVVLFTRRLDYLACLKVRGMRVDLFGNPTEVVSEEEGKNAALKIKKRIEKGIRNARKDLPAKAITHKAHKTEVVRHHESTSERPVHRYPDHPPAFASQSSNAMNNVRTAAVVVKNKISRQFDPEAVARLKAKLGLSLRSSENNEKID